MRIGCMGRFLIGTAERRGYDEPTCPIAAVGFVEMLLHLDRVSLNHQAEESRDPMDTRISRRKFLRGLFRGLGVVWPILSALVALVVALGLVIGLREGWSIQESIYFAFVTSLTIGYGDFAPKFLLTRVLAVIIGLCGVLLTALLAAIAVRALTETTDDREQ
jgi:hypothetical protein